MSSPDSPSQSHGTHEGLLLVIAGPSGVGKTTIVHRLLDTFQGVFSVSATTRPRTDQDVEGVDYFFLDEPTFQQWVDEERFLEHAQVFGRSWYGTPRASVEPHLMEGRLVILDIDVQGATQVRASMPEALGVFILPPSEDVLLQRLRDRAREDEATIERRFSEAQREIETAHSCGAFDAFVVNNDLEEATAEISRIIRERLQSG
ncbi:MAG: guanylate kinase [Phycisphaerales bacterium]|nr:guanylate kinase [Phycisphaerales bacterium]